MTQREFLQAIEKNVDLDTELRDFATERIEKLDERNAKRASKPSKTAIANEPIKADILELLETKNEMVASEIAKELEISVQKASALCRQLAENEQVQVTEIKVKGKGKQKAYSLAQDIDE